MKKMFAITLLFVVLGTGCARPSTTDIIGFSYFGRLVGGEVTESPIKGGWVRPHPGPFWWDEIETSQDVYDWSEADRTVKHWQERDQAILATLWPFAQWDQARCHAANGKVKHPFGDEQVWLNSVCHVESLQEWVGRVVERYDGDGTDDMPGLKDSITHWEIANEPDLQSSEFTFFQNGPRAYIELFQIAHDAIKIADPSATILHAGMSGMSQKAMAWWVEALFADRTRGDLGNIHSIQANVDFNAEAYRGYLDKLRFESRSFWITEALVGSQEEDWSNDEKARSTMIGYAQAFANGAQKVFNVGKHDPRGGPGEASERAFEIVVEVLNGFESVERITDTVVKFEFPRGKVVYALWDDAILPADVKGKVEVVYYDGNKTQTAAKNVKAEKPMFVIVR